MLNVRILAGTFLALAVLGIAAHYWHAFQARRTASVLTERAEALAEEKSFTAAADYYRRYLELCPEDANARLRRAELFEQATGGRGGGQRAIELYREALRPARQALPPEKQLQAQRRLTELLLQTKAFAAAQSEAEKVGELEEKELATKPHEWRGPGLRALALAGKFAENNAAVPSAALEKAFAEVLEPLAGQDKVYVAAEVYLARYDYRLQKGLRNAQDANSAKAYLAASGEAKSDLEAALKLAPANPLVLLTAAAAAQRQAAVLTAAQREAAATAQEANRQKAAESYAKADDYYQRAIQADPADQRAYQGLGQLYAGLGDLDRAIQTWRRGLKEVKTEGECIELDLDLAEALIQEGRLPDAENVLKDLDEILAKLDSRSRLSLQRREDLQSAKLAYLRGHYDEAIRLVADLAAGKEVIPGAEGAVTPQARYKAWIVLGQSHAALKHWDPALAAYEQAALLAPREVVPHLAAAEACKAAGRRDAAIAHYQQALTIVNALKPPPEGQRQAIYEALIALLDEQKRTAEADRYRALRTEQMAESARLTLQGVSRAIRDGKLDEALALAQRGIQSHPEDPLALSRVGPGPAGQQAERQGGRCLSQGVRGGERCPGDCRCNWPTFLVQTRDPNDAAEAEKALRGLLPRHAPACLQLVSLLELRERNDEALSVARSGVASQPKDPLSHIALGTAWWGKKENAKAEAAFQEALRFSARRAGLGKGPAGVLCGHRPGRACQRHAGKDARQGQTAGNRPGAVPRRYPGPAGRSQGCQAGLSESGRGLQEGPDRADAAG